MGIPWEESIIAGQLLGVKTALNEFVAYLYLADTDTYQLTDKSRLIMLYALCGFANFSSVGILLSGLSAMIPERRMDLISVSGKALWGALLASCLTGFMIEYSNQCFVQRSAFCTQRRTYLHHRFQFEHHFQLLFLDHLFLEPW